jgi:hypothetical protein
VARVFLPAVEARRQTGDQQVPDDQVGGGGESVVEQATAVDVIGQCPQPEPVTVGLEVGPLLLIVGAKYLLVAVQSEPSGHHYRAGHRALTDGLAGLGEPGLVVEQGACHPPVPCPGLLVVPGDVEGVRTPRTVSQPPELVHLVSGAGGDRAPPCLCTNKKINRARSSQGHGHSLADPDGGKSTSPTMPQPVRSYTVKCEELP